MPIAYPSNLVLLFQNRVKGVVKFWPSFQPWIKHRWHSISHLFMNTVCRLPSGHLWGSQRCSLQLELLIPKTEGGGEGFLGGGGGWPLWGFSGNGRVIFFLMKWKCNQTFWGQISGPFDLQGTGGESPPPHIPHSMYEVTEVRIDCYVRRPHES